jgi:hypothetical protein
MIDPSCAVAAATAVNHPSIRQPEQECMASNAIPFMLAQRIAPGRHLTLVLQNALTCLELPNSKQTLPMNRRAPDTHAPHILSFSEKLRKYKGKLPQGHCSPTLPRPTVVNQRFANAFDGTVVVPRRISDVPGLKAILFT